MKDIIVIYPVKDTALSIANLLVKNGFTVSHICARGSSALEIAYQKRQGIIVCPFNMSDISASELSDNVPVNFDVVALSKNGSEQYMGNLITLPLPIDEGTFIRTIEVLASSRSSFTKRSRDDDECIRKAKHALMKAKGITEPQAHKMLQNESMRTGKRLVAVAKDVLDEFAKG